MDIDEALTKSENSQLIATCKQLKLKTSDGKFYLTVVVDENGVIIMTKSYLRRVLIIPTIMKQNKFEQIKKAAI